MGSDPGLEHAAGPSLTVRSLVAGAPRGHSVPHRIPTRRITPRHGDLTGGSEGSLRDAPVTVPPLACAAGLPGRGRAASGIVPASSRGGVQAGGTAGLHDLLV